MRLLATRAYKAIPQFDRLLLFYRTSDAECFVRNLVAEVIYSVEFKADTSYTIDVATQDLPIVYLFDDKGKVVQTGLDYIEYFHTERDGIYHILVCLRNGGDEFTLCVAKLSLQGEQKPRNVGNGININDQIGPNDKSGFGKRLGKVYSFELKAGNTYTIDLSRDALIYLFFFDGKNSKRLALSGTQIVFEAKRDGVYHVLVFADGSNPAGGEFTLSVRKKD